MSREDEIKARLEKAKIDSPQLQDMDRAYIEICDNSQWSGAAERLKNIAKSAIRERDDLLTENARLRRELEELRKEAEEFDEMLEGMKEGFAERLRDAERNAP